LIDSAGATNLAGGAIYSGAHAAYAGITGITSISFGTRTIAFADGTLDAQGCRTTVIFVGHLAGQSKFT
jgi:hypothetical protein